MRTLSRSFYLVAAEKATWVTSSSTGAIRENSARVLALGEKQNVAVWKGCFGARRCLKQNIEEPTGGAWGETESERWLPPFTGLGWVRGDLQCECWPPLRRVPILYFLWLMRMPFLFAAGSAQTGTVWSGNTASICAASVSASMRRTSASLRYVGGRHGLLFREGPTSRQLGVGFD